MSGMAAHTTRRTPDHHRPWRRYGALGSLFALLGPVLLGIIALATPASALPNTRYVNSATGVDGTNTCTVQTSPCKTIPRAVLVATAGDTIQVAAGTYTGFLGVNKALTITGAGQASTILNCGCSASTVLPTVLVQTPNATDVVNISGFTIKGGYYTAGGGVYNVKGVLTLSDSTVTGNTSTGFGGGVYSATGPTTLTNDSITANTALYGGGVASNAGTLSVSGSDISNNTATTYGGGVYITAGTATIGSSAIKNNKTTGTANTFGGGLIVVGGTTTVTGTTFSGNSSIYGGGIEATGGLKLNSSTVDGNTATTWGGGIYGNGGPITLDNGTIVTNNTAVIGAGFFVGAGSLTVNIATINNNTASQFGGGGAGYSKTTLNGSGGTFKANTATLGGGGLLVDGTLTMTGASFDSNKTTAANALGGGLFLSPYSTNPDHPVATLSNGSFTNNSAYSGGAAAVGTNSNLSLNGTSVTGNTAPSLGGGLDLAGNGSATLTNASINSNGAAGAGGIALATGTLTTTGGSITGNAAASVGGLYNAGGTATLSGTTISGNTANGQNGGGIYNAGNTTVSDASIDHNSAVQTANNNQTGVGGAIYNQQTTGSLTLQRVAITNNTAAGASAIFNNGPGIIRDSTIGNNDGFSSIAAGTGLALINDTIAGNRSAGGFSGVWSEASSTPIAMAGDVLTGAVGGNCVGTPADGGYNLVDPGDTSCGFTTANHDIIAAPQLNPLANNGGPTLTMLPKPSSPVIDVIPPSTVTSLTDPVAGGSITLCGPGAVDQRSVPRPQGPTCDIGAVEIAVVAPTVSGPSSPQFITGTPGTFSYTTTGVPTPHLSESGALPSGVTFVDNHDGTATLAGTAAAGTAGSYPIVVTAANGISPDATETVTVTVVNPLVITTTSLPSAVVGQAYSASVAVTGGTTPYTWSVITGNLPAGLTIDPATGAITGTPTGPTGSSTFTVQVTDSSNPSLLTTKQFTIVVNAAPTISGPSDVQFVIGLPGSVTYTGTGVPIPTITETGSLPAGITLHDNGDGTATLGGTAAAGTAGSYSITVKAHNGVAADATESVTVRVVAPLTITTATLPGGNIGTPYSASVAVTGGTTPYTWAVTTGSLPAGLAIDPTTGAITGTPAGPAGTSTFTVTVTDSSNPTLTAARTFSIVIGNEQTFLVAAPPLITTQGSVIKITVVTVKGTLTAGPSHTPVAGQTITFTSNGQFLCNAVTNANGDAQCQSTLAAIVYVIAGLGYDANFAGTATLAPSSAHANLL